MDFQNPKSHNFYRPLCFQGRVSSFDFLYILQKPQLVHIYSLFLLIWMQQFTVENHLPPPPIVNTFDR